MAFDGVLVQGYQGMEMVSMGSDFLLAQPHPQPDMPAADHRLIAVVRIDVKSQAGCSLGQGVPGLVQPVAGSAPDSNRNVIHGEKPRSKTLLLNRILRGGSVRSNR